MGYYRDTQDMTDKKNKTQEIRLNIRIPESEKQDVKEVAAQAGITETLLIRTAVKKQITAMRKRIAEGKDIAIVV